MGHLSPATLFLIGSAPPWPPFLPPSPSHSCRALTAYFTARLRSLATRSGLRLIAVLSPSPLVPVGVFDLRRFRVLPSPASHCLASFPMPHSRSLAVSVTAFRAAVCAASLTASCAAFLAARYAATYAASYAAFLVAHVTATLTASCTASLTARYAAPLCRFMYRLPDRFLRRLIDRYLCRLLDRSVCRLLDRVPYRPPKGFLARLFSRFAFASLAALVTPLSSAAHPPFPFVGLQGLGSRASAQGTRAPRVLPPPSGTSRRMEIRHFHHRLTEVPSVDMLIEAWNGSIYRWHWVSLWCGFLHIPQIHAPPVPVTR